MTGGQTGEPTLADIQRQFPEWPCARGNNGLWYAQHRALAIQVIGEDLLDLSDQIKAAERRRSYGQHEPEASIPRQAGAE